jgi:hypothetical protein
MLLRKAGFRSDRSFRLLKGWEKWSRDAVNPHSPSNLRGIEILSEFANGGFKDGTSHY